MTSMERKRAGMPGDLESVDSSDDSSDESSDDSSDDMSESSSDDADDDSSSSSSSSSSSDSSKGDSDSYSGTNDDDEDSENRDETEEINKLIRKESKDVLMWREIVTAMLVITAALATITTFVFLSREDDSNFSDGFAVVADTIKAAVESDFLTLAESMRAVGDVMTTYALTGSIMSLAAPWPHVTMPAHDFDRHVQHVHSLSSTHAVWTAPIVTNQDYWETNYSIKVPVTEDVPVSKTIFAYNENLKTKVKGKKMVPIRQMHPAPYPVIPGINVSLANFDMLSEPGMNETLSSVNVFKRSTLTNLVDLEVLRLAYPETFTSDEPISLMVQPIFDNFDNRTVMAYVFSVVEWKYILSNIIGGETVDKDLGAYALVKHSCSSNNFTMKIEGPSARFVAMGDAREFKSDKNIKSVNIRFDGNEDSVEKTDSCLYEMSLYPTKEMDLKYDTKKPQIYTTIIGAVFFIMAATFFSYDSFVKRRNDKVIQAAARSNAIVSSLFPSNIRDRLFKAEDEKNENLPKTGLKGYLRNDGDLKGRDKNIIDSKPLADLFPETTIMFADIAGFTAWSSVREPTQVFVLLETMYAAFDLIARRRRIFKVETIGDCYVAVAGLPEPRKDHAIAMAKFASDVLKKAHDLTRRLEVTLGPDTGDLTMRVGLHSGPVTAGVLRGERSRFQLFGDTMNTAARMEHNGERGKIQISQETADLLIAAGKSHWLKPRDDTIIAKGKGEMNTYWLDCTTDSKNGSSRGSDAGTESGNSANDAAEDNSEGLGDGLDTRKTFSDKTERLIDWNVDILLRLLQQIVAHRDSKAKDDNDDLHQLALTNPFDEVKEIIALPEFKETRKLRDPAEVKISDSVAEQLRTFVSTIAGLYQDNAFHNFEHASHVTMSVTKLLSRIVAPSDVLDDYRDRAQKDLVSTLHDHTYGITSDPLTQFACVFSALIHDTDHSGAPNTQLVKENVELAERYGGKSVAEQNSIDLAWGLLMEPQYKELRRTICLTKDEFSRFRQLVVNTVMATDIMDPDLKMLRNLRWSKAFSEGGTVSDPDPRDQVNRKATIVIEHLIQASDVSHTMQHWHIYRQWNERFFVECYEAFKDGRTQADPSVGWYQGEIGFFDFYIIPLAKKLKDCGVFGVSSDEYLQYAMKNRKEWEQRGQEVVAEMMQKVNAA